MLAFERPYWGDEIHFVETINRFGKNMGLNTIKHYNEMSTPLPFMLYALWGRIFGFEIHILRILSVIIAVATYILFHWLLFLIFGNIKVASLTSAFLVLHPYMVGFSVFVFTDMETGYKVFRRQILEDITLKSDRFGFEPEFTVKVAKKGFRIYEVSISYSGRTYSEGKKITWRDGIVAIFTILWYKFFD